jgi:ATP-dependent RNA helicase RhlE
MNKFSDYPFLPTIQATLAEKGLVEPTEIQALALPAMLGGKSIVGVAETGSGKTLTYALPILHQLKSLENEGDRITEEAQPRAVVLVPSRELGEQISKVFKPFTHTTRLRVRAALGGTTMEMTRRSVAGAFEVLVATPGRLGQLLDLELLSLGDVRTLVIDEADQILDDGFLTIAKRIKELCPEDCQKALFSATVSKNVQDLMNRMFAEAEVIRTSGNARVVATLTTKNWQVVDGKRLPLLDRVLKEQVSGGTIIFANTREQCDAIHAAMNERGITCALYRGEMDKIERRKNLKAFRDGSIDFLIATDLGSRGLDVEHVGRVINYHLPKGMDNYLHRVGRTARAGRSGLVINFVTERDEDLINRLEQVKPAKKPAKKPPSRTDDW